MKLQIQCPVCTLFLHNGINLKTHLTTHSKNEIIKSLVTLTQQSSDQDAAASVFECRKCAAKKDIFINQVKAEVGNVVDDYINQADLNSKFIEPYEEEYSEISSQKLSNHLQIDDDYVGDKDQYMNRRDECKILDTIAEIEYEMETGDMEIGKEQLYQSRYELSCEDSSDDDGLLTPLKIGTRSPIEFIRRDGSTQTCAKLNVENENVERKRVLPEDISVDYKTSINAIRHTIYRQNQPISYVRKPLTTSPPTSSNSNLLRPCTVKIIKLDLYNYNAQINTRKDSMIAAIKHVQPKPTVENCLVGKKCGIQKHVRTTGEKRHVCRICKEQFRFRSGLQIHFRVHTDQKPFGCEVCPKTFNQQAHLLMHMKIHTGEKPYICNVCQKTFMRQLELSMHIRIHTGERPYKCNVCQKAFKQHSALSRHKNIHTGAKPWICDICQKAFTQLSNLSTHKKKNHSNLTKFSCAHCEKSFLNRTSLKKHLMKGITKHNFQDRCGDHYK